MVLYRRNRVAGGTNFFTVAIRNRKAALLTDHIDLLRAAVHKTRLARPFTIDAWVVLPEHMHAIWTLPPGDTDYSTRWRSIKAHFSHELAKCHEHARRSTKGEYGFWQRRFWEHTIRDETDFSRHVDYIHYNPVKHGHVLRAVGCAEQSEAHRSRERCFLERCAPYLGTSYIRRILRIEAV